MDPDVVDNASQSRFELTSEGQTAIAAYERDGDTIVFTHTVVPEALEGHGIGSRLIAHALDTARARQLSVVPQCAFVKAYIDKHPAYADLLVSGYGT